MKRLLALVLATIISTVGIFSFAAIASDETEGMRPENVFGDSLVINNDGEVEQLTIDDLMKIHSDNQLRWDNKYVGAKVLVTSDVKEINTDEWLVLETDSYTPKIVLHLGDGWIVSGADSDLVENLSTGDRVQFAGTITGFMKHKDGVAVIYTGGNATCVQMAEESEGIGNPGLLSIIKAYIDRRCFKDAEFWFDFYKENYSEDEEGIASVQTSLDDALASCYQGTYLERYDSMFVCTDVVECDVENYGEGYDYYDPGFAMNANTYIKYLQNNGFSSQGNYSATVNGVEDAYVALTNPDDVIVALAQGDDYVRILVWSKEAYGERKNQAENGSEEPSGTTTYTDVDIIMKVQEALNNAGYDCGAADGKKGPHTTEVIQQYQTDNGLDVTGEIDDALLSSLGLK